MLVLPNVDFHVNKFTDVKLPTKAQIFSRTGQRAVTPNGIFTGDDPARIGLSLTEQAEYFVREAESFEVPKSDD